MKFSKRLVNKHLNVFIIMLFEFFGTGLFGYININLINLMKSTTSPVDKEIYTSIDFALSMFMCISYGRQFSGGLYNPAVALFRMFRKTDRFPVKLGLLYMGVQFMGSIAGCCFAFWIDELHTTTITQILPAKIQLQQFYVEMLGTCVLTLMVQTVSEKKMTFIEHNREFYICLPLFYLIARQYSSISNGINPGLGLGFQFAYCLFKDKWHVFPMTYILVIGPLAGALVSVFLFEFLLKPLYPIKRAELMKQLEQIQRQRQEKQTPKQLQQIPIATITELVRRNSHRFSMGEIINLEPNEQIYSEVPDDYTMVADDDINDQIQSVSDDNSQEGENHNQFPESQKSDITFRVMGKFQY